MVMVASAQEEIHEVRARLMDAIQKRHTSIMLKIIRHWPQVLTEKDDNGSTPLHLACSSGAHPTVIQLLVDWGSKAIEMTNIGGNTPLHMACFRSVTPLETLSILIEAKSEALTRGNSLDRTPLHLACQHLRNSPETLWFLLDRSPRSVLSMRDNVGWTPLHVSCFYNVSLEIIRRIIRLYPKDLRMLSKLRTTPLHISCESSNASREVIELLTRECPETCLLLARWNRSPYDTAVRRRRSADIINLLQEATKDAVIALLVCASNTLIHTPPAVMEHIYRVLPNLEGFSMSHMSTNGAIHQILENQDTLKTLLNNRDLQDMLKQDDCQDLIRGVYYMIKVARSIDGDNVQLEAKDHVYLLGSVSETTDCLYLHLRNNPSLFTR
jgi:ankyrin repeat protein